MAQKLEAAAATAAAGAPDGAAAAGAPPPQHQQRAVPPVTEGFDELMTKGVKELKALLAERGISHADCLEKADLAQRIVERCSRATHYV
jgi:hypothetical protein